MITVDATFYGQEGQGFLQTLPQTLVAQYAPKNFSAHGCHMKIISQLSMEVGRASSATAVPP